MAGKGAFLSLVPACPRVFLFILRFLHMRAPCHGAGGITVWESKRVWKFKSIWEFKSGLEIENLEIKKKAA
ncbi:MAG: hypothetical protein ACYCSN_04780 [Acidobacteriaceae bacterium]